MKWLFLLMILLVLPMVNADIGRTFEVDFDVKEEYDLWLMKSDRILFEYGGYNHTIIVDNIKESTMEVDVFLFLEEKLHNPNYINLNQKYDIGLDFDKDGNKELAIALAQINEDKERGKIILTRLESWDNNTKLFPLWKDEKPGIGGGMNIYVYWRYFVGGIVLLFLGFLISFFKKGEKGVYY